MPATGDRKKDFVGPKGATFTVGSDNTGLYHVEMLNGGVRPDICDQRFTNVKDAEKVIIKYIKGQTARNQASISTTNNNKKVADKDASRKPE